MIKIFKVLRPFLIWNLHFTARLSGNEDPDNEDLEELEELISSESTVSILRGWGQGGCYVVGYQGL